MEPQERNSWANGVGFTLKRSQLASNVDRKGYEEDKKALKDYSVLWGTVFVGLKDWK